MRGRRIISLPIRDAHLGCQLVAAEKGVPNRHCRTIGSATAYYRRKSGYGAGHCDVRCRRRACMAAAYTALAQGIVAGDDKARLETAAYAAARRTALYIAANRAIAAR